MNRTISTAFTRSLLPAATLLLAILPLIGLCADQPAAGGTVCTQCHGSLSGPGGAPVNLWKESIHAENGISCHDCHGGDPKDAANAMSPERGFLGAPEEAAIPGFCGRCHVGIKDDYLQSAHGHALGKGGPTCVTCHGNHAVKKASLELINEKSCSRCHPYGRAAEIKEAMRRTEELIVTVDRKIQLFKGEGVDTESREKSLFAVRNTYHRLFHEVDTAKVNRESAHIRVELEKIDNSLAAITAERHTRRLIGVAIVGALLVAALLLHLLKKSYD